jgi:hypothetical protein
VIISAYQFQNSARITGVSGVIRPGGLGDLRSRACRLFRLATLSRSTVCACRSASSARRLPSATAPPVLRRWVVPFQGCADSTEWPGGRVCCYLLMRWARFTICVRYGDRRGGHACLRSVSCSRYRSGPFDEPVEDAMNRGPAVGVQERPGEPSVCGEDDHGEQRDHTGITRYRVVSSRAGRCA